MIDWLEIKAGYNKSLNLQLSQRSIGIHSCFTPHAISQWSPVWWSANNVALKRSPQRTHLIHSPNDAQSLFLVFTTQGSKSQLTEILWNCQRRNTLDIKTYQTTRDRVSDCKNLCNRDRLESMCDEAKTVKSEIKHMDSWSSMDLPT